MQPMVRNAGESLGVSAELNLIDSAKGLYKSSVEVKNLNKMEQMIAGNPPNVKDGFSGLTSPRWPEDLLGKINWPLADKGGELYKEHCQECHRPPLTIYQRDANQPPKPLPNPAYFNFEDKKEWRTNDIGQPVRIIENIPIKHVGTDPAQAADMMNRTVALPANLGIKDSAFALALKDVVEKTVNYIYDRMDPPLNKTRRDDYDGNMPNEVRGKLEYKVRPLNGVWATPPYLHNGSVPNVYLLLSPVEERPKEFHLGHREYDPVNLGYKYDELKNGFFFETRLRGNRNMGHEFNDRPEDTPGKVGKRTLLPDERKALIEFLKTQ
jgi:hypothetical protein